MLGFRQTQEEYAKSPQKETLESDCNTIHHVQVQGNRIDALDLTLSVLTAKASKDGQATVSSLHIAEEVSPYYDS